MIKQASVYDCHILSELAIKLWPHHSIRDFESEYTSILSSENVAAFLCIIGSDAIAFAQCQLRNDYVEGTESSPVGYLEGIFVDKKYCHSGIAKELLQYCEAWAKSKGCIEFASDCELGNMDSLEFHLKVGFKEANRIICFTKKL